MGVKDNRAAVFTPLDIHETAIKNAGLSDSFFDKARVFSGDKLFEK